MTQPTNENNSFGYYFNAFASTTAFHGFVHYQQSENWIRQSFWICLILLCSALTILDLYGTLAAFVNEELISTTQIVRSQEISFPDATMCIEFNTTMLDYRPIDITNQLSVDNFLSLNAKFILEMFYCGEDCDDWDRKHWNDARLRPALMLVTSLVAELTNLENPYIENVPLLPNKIAFAFFARQERPANFSQVLQRSGLWLCRIMKLRAVFFKQDSVITEETDVCKDVMRKKPRSTLWIGAQPAEKSAVENFFDEVCFRLGDLLGFNSWAKSRVFLIFNEMNLYVPSYQYADRVPSSARGRPGLAVVGTPQVHFKFLYSGAGFSNRSSASQPISLAKATRRIAYNLRLVGKYVQYQKRVGRACGDVGYMKCAREKWALQFVSCACRCFPFSWTLFYDFRRYTDVLCTDPVSVDKNAAPVPRILETQCWNTIANFSDDNEAYNAARAQCLPLCVEQLMSTQYDVFSDQALSVVREGWSGVNSTNLDESAIVSFRVADFSYLSVTEEEPKIEMSSLFAQIGGNLSMWLGGSIISLIHLILTIVDYLVHRVVPPANPETIWGKRFEDMVDEWNRKRKCAVAKEQSGPNRTRRSLSS